MRTELSSSSVRNASAELKLKLLTEGMRQRVGEDIEGQSGSAKRNGSTNISWQRQNKIK